MTVSVPARTRRTLLSDLLVALLVVALLEGWFAVASTGGAPPPGAAGRLLLAAAAASLVLRRVAPASVLAVNVAADLASRTLGDGSVPLPLGVLVALVAVSLVRSPLVPGAAAAGYLAVLVAGARTGGLPLDDDGLFVHLVAVEAAVVAGHAVGRGQHRARCAEQRVTELIGHQGSRMQAAVEQERARIAREVHDLVAGGVSVMVAQAAAARSAPGTGGRAVVATLSAIEAVGRDTLDGLRRLLGVVRTGGPDEGRSLRSDLGKLPWLVDQVGRAGLPTEFVVRGTPRPVPATVELNAFRIVQESLTNSLRHAGPTRATVTVTYADESLGVEVRDLGRGAGTRAGPGNGLPGMRDRAAALGGQLEAGPDAERGFRVTARLPAGGAR